MSAGGVHDISGRNCTFTSENCALDAEGVVLADNAGRTSLIKVNLRESLAQ